MLIFTVDDRYRWGRGEQAKERSVDVSQLPTTVSQQPRLYSDHQSCSCAEGKTIWILLDKFNTEREYDFVTLTDGDGTDLTDQLRHGGTFLSGKKVDDLPFGYSSSNIVHVHFHTDGNTQRSGWRLEWEAMVG